jgi:thioredoxin reductase
VKTYDVVIVGAGPGGVGCALKAEEHGLSYLLLEKGDRVFQGIIDSYPHGKKVYPTIPRGCNDPFAMPELEPSATNEPVEEYVAKIEACVEQKGINIVHSEDFQGITGEPGAFTVLTAGSSYAARNVVLAFGSNIPVDLGVYGEAKTIARRLDNTDEHIGAPTLVLGGGNAAADVVATLSRAKRAARDKTPVYWGHRKEQFKVNKAVARDLGEEILLGGNIKILLGAIPKIGEVDEEGVDRLFVQTSDIPLGQGVEMQQGMSFPMKHVIACIGTQGPAPIYEQLKLQMITCTGGICRIGREGSRLILLDAHFQTSTPGIYAIGGAISPSYIAVEDKGSFQEVKHPNLIYTAMQDAQTCMANVAARLQKDDRSA